MTTAPSRATIDLAAYAHNLSVVRSLIPEGCRILAVVKADAYGHGAAPIAKRAVEEGVAMLGVATVNEGIALRESGIAIPIVVLVQPSHDQLQDALDHDLRICTSDIACAEKLGKIAQRVNKVAPIHCEIDTGMGRLGFDVTKAAAELMFLTRVSFIDIEAIMTHFPVAESPGDTFTSNQIKAFKQHIKELGQQGIPYEFVHAANSAAIVNHASSIFDMVRPGLMTYGVWPVPESAEDSRLKAVLSWTSRIVAVRDLPVGASVGYGRSFTTRRPTRIAIVPVGYADGYPFALGNKADVLVRGKRCPVRGRVSMDQTIVDVTEVSNPAVGDHVTLIGTEGSETISAAELASRAGTIPYEILAGIGARVERVYIE
jgi:alanine racemase